MEAASAVRYHQCRQAHGCQDEREVFVTRHLHALFTRAGLDRPVPPDLKDVPQELQVLRVVFDDQDQLIRYGAPGS
jgi:hypothetical protein